MCDDCLGLLQTFVMTENPTTCPQCGRRTEGQDLPDGLEHHTCSCGFEFLMAQDFDGEEQCNNDDCRGFEKIEVLEANAGLCARCVVPDLNVRSAVERWLDD